MNKTKLVFDVLEKVFFVAIVAIVIIYASGYKLDPQKVQFVETGVLKLENIEDSTTISFNKNIYKDERNVSVYQLDEKQYNLEVKKDNRNTYKTSIDIKKGSVSYVDPILIPTFMKINSLQNNIHSQITTKKGLYYTYENNNKLSFDVIVLNKTIFSLDKNKITYDISKYFTLQSKVNIYAAETDNTAILSDGTKYLLIKTNNTDPVDISGFMPKDKLNTLKIEGDYILANFDQNIISIDISSSPKFQRILINSSTNSIFTTDENRNLYLIFPDGKNINLQIYSPNGTNQSQKIVANSVGLNINKSTPIFYKDKILYIISDNKFYQINNDGVLSLKQQNVNSAILEDKNSYGILFNNKINYSDRDREYSLTTTKTPVEVYFCPDDFTIFYLDTEGSLHLADFGGQDNIIQTKVDANFLIAQNNPEVQVYFVSQGELKNFRFGNDN